MTERRPIHETSRAARYWNQVLDPQNLERGEPAGSGPTLEDEIRFAETPDWEGAGEWLTGGLRSPRWIVDLGAGLGAHAFAFAGRGHRVIAADASLDRLRSLRERANGAGCADRIVLVVADAEALPFANNSVPAVFTKSVLIHTNLERTAAELARTLAKGGRAALVEPQPTNPFVWLYRKTLAPRAWQSITRYFDPAAQGIYFRAVPTATGRPAIRPFYFTSFFAFVFQFGWANVRWFYRVLRPLNALDGWLFRRFPALSRWAWFGVIELEKD